jgi:hypothetical protein
MWWMAHFTMLGRAFAVTPTVYPLPTWMIMLTVDVILLLTLTVEVLIKRFR